MKKWLRPSIRTISSDQLITFITVAARSITCERKYVR